jgi:hypothetical protein
VVLHCILWGSLVCFLECSAKAWSNFVFMFQHAAKILNGNEKKMFFLTQCDYFLTVQMSIIDV